MKSAHFGIALFVSAMAISGCQTNTNSSIGGGVVSETQDGLETAVSATSEGLGDALMAPLTDLNLRRKEIPDELKRYASAYDPLQDRSCLTLQIEIERLTTVLGPDSDFILAEASRGEKTGRLASNATLSAVSGTSRGILPFNGLIRTASGASKYEREFDRAYKLGFERRAYLKGLGEAQGCAPPAAPLPIDAEVKD